MFSVIVAMGQNGAIGIDNKLPWNLKNDLARFKKITMGQYIIMGRKTYESLPKRLEGRKYIIMTQNKDFKTSCSDDHICVSIEDVMKITTNGIVIGGASIYELFIDSGLVERIYLTEVMCRPHADTFFPKWKVGVYTLMKSEYFPADNKNGIEYAFKEYDRIDTSIMDVRWINWV